MSSTRVCASLMALTILVIALAGCGGGKKDPQPTTINGRLESGDWVLGDDTYVDRYECKARETAEAQVIMHSEEVDCFLFVYRKRSDGGLTLIAGDDDSGSGLDARVQFDAVDGTVYEVRANSYRRGSGSYTLTFSKQLGDVQQIRPSDRGETRLPGIGAKQAK
ncbi:MAG: hypothetical protein HY321_17575 [Armatimonadetes bacterium]|nr:hypothetical protein [Armatimonadota bacterium]